MKIALCSVLFIFILLPFAFAQKYAVQQKDGSILIWNYVDDPGLLNQKAKDLGYSGLQVIPITEDDLPNADQKYWILNPSVIGQKIIVDTNKLVSDQNAQVQKQQNKSNALKKFCSQCTAQDLSDLLS